MGKPDCHFLSAGTDCPWSAFFIGWFLTIWAFGFSAAVFSGYGTFARVWTIVPVACIGIVGTLVGAIVCFESDDLVESKTMHDRIMALHGVCDWLTRWFTNMFIMMAIYVGFCVMGWLDDTPDPSIPALLKEDKGKTVSFRYGKLPEETSVSCGVLKVDGIVRRVKWGSDFPSYEGKIVSVDQMVGGKVKLDGNVSGSSVSGLYLDRELVLKKLLEYNPDTDDVVLDSVLLVSSDMRKPQVQIIEDLKAFLEPHHEEFAKWLVSKGGLLYSTDRKMQTLHPHRKLCTEFRNPAIPKFFSKGTIKHRRTFSNPDYLPAIKKILRSVGLSESGDGATLCARLKENLDVCLPANTSGTAEVQLVSKSAEAKEDMGNPSYSAKFRSLQQQARKAGVPEREVNLAADTDDLRKAIARALKGKRGSVVRRVSISMQGRTASGSGTSKSSASVAPRKKDPWSKVLERWRETFLTLIVLVMAVFTMRFLGGYCKTYAGEVFLEANAAWKQSALQLREETFKAGAAFLEANSNKEGVVVRPSGLQYKVLAHAKDGARGCFELSGPQQELDSSEVESEARLYAMQLGIDTGIEAGNLKMSNTLPPCTVRYHGTLISGDVFDSRSATFAHDQAEFEIHPKGKHRGTKAMKIIAGWKEAMTLMKEGDKWELYVPSELAYGDDLMPAMPRFGLGAVPQGSAVIFEFEILGLRGMRFRQKGL